MEKPRGKTTRTGITLGPAGINPASLGVWVLAVIFALFLFWHPYEIGAAGNRILAGKLKNYPESQQAVVLLVISGFSTSVSAMYSSDRPKLAAFFRVSSSVILSSAAAIVLLAMFVF